MKWIIVIFVLVCGGTLRANDKAILTLENVPPTGPIQRASPAKQGFSPQRAAKYLDIASLNWQKNRECVTCHTNMAYLMARPALEPSLGSSGEVRKFFETQVIQEFSGEPSSLRLGDFTPVVTSLALSFHDAQHQRELSEAAQKSLKAMWETQKDDGSWNWLKCGWAPMEIDDHYGVTLAALAVGVAPGDYSKSQQAMIGINRLRTFLNANPTPSLHHRVMLAWCSKRIDGLMSEEARQKLIKELWASQLVDGGWSIAAMLADWSDFRRKDSQAQQLQSADAYATGLVLVVLRELGVPSDDERIQSGANWLFENQEVDGKWFSPSPTKDSKQYFTNIGSAFAVLGLQAAGKLPNWPFD